MLAWLGDWAGARLLTVGSGTFLVVAALEVRSPLQPTESVARRWATNFGLYALALTLVAGLAPGRLAGALDGWIGAPVARLGEAGGEAAILAAGLVLLDFLSYWIHRLQHLGPCWRFHHVHHADRDMDTSTAVRHHPCEMLLNAVLSAVFMALLGIPTWVVPVYGLAVLVSDFWQHANTALPARLDRWLSFVMMTPGVHRIHHSEATEHHDTNFGSILTIWDHLFRTWCPQTTAPLRFGVVGVDAQGPLRALVAPFRRR